MPMRTTVRVLTSFAVLVFSAVTAAAQSAGRVPEAGTATTGGTTLVDNQNRVTSTGVLRLWQAYSTQGGRALLKVYRPEGSRLVMVGASAMETVPAGEVATFECSIPVSRNDIIGVFCPDAGCVDRFADGQALSVAGGQMPQRVQLPAIESGSLSWQLDRLAVLTDCDGGKAAACCRALRIEDAGHKDSKVATAYKRCQRAKQWRGRLSDSSVLRGGARRYLNDVSLPTSRQLRQPL